MSKKPNTFAPDDSMSTFQSLVTAAQQAQSYFQPPISTIFAYNPSMGMGGMGGSSTFGPGMGMGGMGGSSTFGPGMAMGGMGFPQQGQMFNTMAQFSGPMAGGGYNQMVPFSGHGGMQGHMGMPAFENPFDKIKEQQEQIDDMKAQINKHSEERHAIALSQQRVVGKLAKFCVEKGLDLDGEVLLTEGKKNKFIIKEYSKKNCIRDATDSEDSDDCKQAKKKAKKQAKKQATAAQKNLVEKMAEYQTLNPKSDEKLTSKAKQSHKTAGGAINTQALKDIKENRKLFGYIYVCKDPYTLANDQDKEAYAEFKKINGLPAEPDWDGNISDSD